MEFYLALARQLADSLLNRQVARCVILRNLDATVWTSRDLVTQTTVGQQVREASGTHQMTELTLKRLEMKENKKIGEETLVSYVQTRMFVFMDNLKAKVSLS